MGQLSRSVAAPMLAVLGAAVIGVLVLLATDHSPSDVGEAFADRVLLRPSGIEESLVAMTPILLAALAAWVAARVGLWNIGIDGQVVAGAIAAGALAPLLDDWPRVAMWFAATAAGVGTGALLVLLPAALRVRGGVNEIVTTIMMTYVAFSLGSWLVKGPLGDESVVAPTTVAIDVARRLPSLFDSRVHLGVVVAIAVVLLAGAVARWTLLGILSRLVGESAPAARRIGLPVERYVFVGFLLSGGIAALAGVTEVLATRGAVPGDWQPSLTLPAFAALFVARRHVLALIPAAFLLGMLAHAASVLPRAVDLAPDFFPMLEGVLLILLAVERWRRPGRVEGPAEGRA